MFQLHYNSFVCVPVEALDVDSPEYQYTEIGDIGNLSHQIAVNFPIAAGDWLDCWVIASVTQSQIETLAAAVDDAVAAQEAAEEAQAITEAARDSALDYRDAALAAQQAAENARDFSQDYAADSEQWANTAQAIVDELQIVEGPQGVLGDQGDPGPPGEQGRSSAFDISAPIPLTHEPADTLFPCPITL
jgi:hypothetical protein